MTDTPSIYDQLGEEKFTQLVAAFYRRVTQDTVLKPLYPDADFEGAERRLRMFLVQYFGGSTQYSQERGHPRLRMRHAYYQIGERERDHWVTAMLSAMDEVKIPEPTYTAMKEYFQNGATFLMNTST